MDYSKIKELCTAQGLSIPQLAEKIGVSKSFYTSLKNETLSVSTLEKIADALEVPVAYFFTEGEDAVVLPKSSLKKLIKKMNDAIKITLSLNEKLLSAQNLSSKARISQFETLFALNEQDRMLYNLLIRDREYREMDFALKKLNEILESKDYEISISELIELSNLLEGLHNALSNRLINLTNKDLHGF